MSAYDNDPRVVKVNHRLYRLPSPEAWIVQLEPDGYWRGRDKYESVMRIVSTDSPDPVIHAIIGPPR